MIGKCISKAIWVKYEVREVFYTEVMSKKIQRFIDYVGKRYKDLLERYKFQVLDRCRACQRYAERKWSIEADRLLLK